MKPDWSNAPPWANYLARNQYGVWAWYENKPTRIADCWVNKSGKLQVILNKPEGWETSLEERPKCK